MANTLRFKRGLLAGLPSAAVGEPLFTTDTFDLYIGTASGTQKYQKFIASGTTSQLLRGDGSLLTMPIVLTSPSNGQVLKYNGTSWVNDSDAGITGSGLAGQVAYFTGATTQGGSNNLFWDATNNRLGIGTNAPIYPLDINSSVNYLIRVRNTAGTLASTIVFSNTSGDFYIGNDSVGGGALSGTPYARAIWGQGAYPMVFATNNLERMRLHAGGNLHIGGTSDNGLRFQVTGDGYFSGSVGIGTTPTEKLEVSASNVMVKINAATNSYPQLAFYENSSLKWNAYNDFNNDNYVLGNSTGPKFYLNQEGNLGLGVVPSAWDSVYRVFQIGGNPALASQEAVQMVANGYYNAGWKYIANNYAARYEINKNNGGIHAWYNAPSGTAGNPISFVQAMTLDASGNLAVGTSTATQRLTVNGTINVHGGGNSFIFGTSGANTRITGDNSGGTNSYLSIFTNGSNRLHIPEGGNVILGWTGSDTGEKLQVNGTMRVSGATKITTGTDGIDIGAQTGNSYRANAIFRGTTSAGAAVNAYTGVNVFSTDGSMDIAVSGSNALKFYTAGILGLTIASNQAATFSSSVSATSVTAGGRTILAGSYIADLSGSGNDVGIVFSSSGILSSTGSGTLAAKNLGSSANPWGNLWAGAATFSSSVTAGSLVSGSTTTNGYLTLSRGVNTTFESAIVFRTSGVGNWIVGNRANSTEDFIFYNGTTATDSLRITASTGAATFSSSVTANDVLTASSTGGGTSAIFRNLGAQNSNGIELRGGTAGTSVNWKIEKDNTVANAFQITPSTTNGGTTYTTPSLTILNTGAATFSSSVTLSGNLTVDTNTLFVDAATNRVGIGIASPLDTLHVNGGDLFFGNESNVIQNIRFRRNGATVGSIGTYGNQIEINGGSTLGAGHLAITSTGNVGISNTSPSYKLDVTGSARISDAIAIGTTPDTNLPFKILKNINSTVGIRFENTSTGASSFTGYQFGTDVSGGTAFTNFLYASSGVAETGVYKPNGTALINTGSGGLNFLAVSQPIRFFTSTGNGTLRAAITNDGDFTQYNGTNPSASTTDAFRMYSADITAGNAAPHFRTENGGIIKLYQQTTGVTSATYIGGAGTTVTDLDTFDGYTIPQIVKALRNAGLLA